MPEHPFDEYENAHFEKLIFFNLGEWFSWGKNFILRGDTLLVA